MGDVLMERASGFGRQAEKKWGVTTWTRRTSEQRLPIGGIDRDTEDLSSAMEFNVLKYGAEGDDKIRDGGGQEIAREQREFGQRGLEMVQSMDSLGKNDEDWAGRNGNDGKRVTEQRE
ncbi:unnamed protein product [Calypogeia fissa]